MLPEITIAPPIALVVGGLAYSYVYLKYLMKCQISNMPQGAESCLDRFAGDPDVAGVGVCIHHTNHLIFTLL